MEASHRLGDRGIRKRADHRPGVGAVERQVDLGEPGGGLELALIGEVVAAEGRGSSSVRGSQRITHSPVTRSGLSTASPLGVSTAS